MRSARFAFTCASEVGNVGNANRPINANQNDDEDENKLPSELGIHAGWLTLLRFRLKSRNGAAGNLHFHLLGDAQLDGVIFEAHDRAINSAVGDDFIAVLQIRQHFVTFFWRRCAGMIIKK